MNFLLKTPFYLLFFSFFLFNNFAVKAAEKISFNYGPMEFSLSVKSLEVFAEEGKIEPELAFYLNRLSVEKQQKLRDLLQTNYQVNPVIVSRFAHSTAGKRLIKEVGELIQLRDGSNGFSGIRGSLVQSATDPKGITLINCLRNFPTDLKLNTGKIIKVVKELSHLSRETKDFMAKIDAFNQEQLTGTNNTNNEQLFGLNQLTNFKIKQETREFYDHTRQRKLVVDFYLPENVNQGKIPVIFIANGIGARRNRFKSLAEHLAQSGFAVIIPDNPGSSHQRQQDFLRGLYRENFDVEEFIDLPLDVSFILDQLEEINGKLLENKLNLTDVGIFGYSFGGTTALSLAGAKFNLEQLKNDCDKEFNPLNISAFYQCRILEISPDKFNNLTLKDERIKAVFLFVPFGKSLFGEQGFSQVKIPVFWQVTDQDLITPLMLEQIPAFNWLTNSDKYLVVSQGLPHALTTLNAQEKVTSLEKIREVMATYLNTLSLIYFKVYLAKDENYRPFLDYSFLAKMSEKPYYLHLLKTGEMK